MAGEADVISGVASGASTGSSILPGWGTLIGGVIGGVVGLASRSKKLAARRNIRRANKLHEDVYRLRSFAEQRNLLRTGQVQAAAAVGSAPGTGADVSSSLFQGINGSVFSQLLDNYLLGSTILNDQLKANALQEKAGKQIDQAANISALLGATSEVVSALPKGRRPQTGNLDDVSTAGLDQYRRPSPQVETFPVPGGLYTQPLQYTAGGN